MGVSNIMTERFQLPTTTLIIFLSLHSAHALFSLQLIVDIVFSDTPFLSREGGGEYRGTTVYGGHGSFILLVGWAKFSPWAHEVPIQR